jgi:DNA-binding response OmpR family regulator
MLAAATRGIGVETVPDIARSESLRTSKDVRVLLLDIDTAPSSTEAFELIGELAARSPAISVLVLAESGAFTDRIQAMRRGAAAFLQKPSSPNEVLDVVARYVDDSETRGLRLLALDDDPHILAALHGMLEPTGIQLTMESDPLRFWEVLEEVTPDLLILDLDLPHVSGIEICRMIRSDRRWSGLPILFLTARTDAEAVRTIFAAGADDYLAKPITGPELLTRIHGRWKRMRLDRRPAGVAVSPGDAAELHRLDPAADGARADAASVDVVVVEDDETLGTLLIHSLEARGYTTRWMQDGQAASAALGGEGPAVRARVVLLDVDLPGLNGLALLRQLVRDGVGRHTRFIMLTLRSEEREVVQALEIGAFDHVAKPFSVPVLMQRIRRALEA